MGLRSRFPFRPGRTRPRPHSPIRGAKKQDIRVVTITHVRSGVCRLHGDFQPGMDIRMLHPVNPESHTRARTPVTYDPQRMPGYARALFPLTSHPVGRQDNWAVRPQNGSYLKPGGQRGLSSRFDKAGLRYRRVHNELMARQKAGDYSYLPDGDPGRDVSEVLGIAPRR